MADLDDASTTTEPAVDAYIATFPPEVSVRLTAVRDTLHRAVPGAGEKIAYGIPTLTLEGRSVVHFSAWKHHLSIYPQPDAEGAEDEAIDAYGTGKGTLQFPHRQDLPLELIARIGALLAGRADSAG